ncbi:hypothetical protein Ancab_003802 [Ancistrocladus abbreviatus]
MVLTESNGSSPSETDDISLILRHLLHRSSSSSLPSSSSPSTITPMAAMQTPLSFSSPTTSSGVTGVVLPNNLRCLPSQPELFSGSDRLEVDRISAAESSSVLNTSTGVVLSHSSCFPVRAGASAVLPSLVRPVESESTLTCSVQLRGFDNDTTEEYDCDSEEAPEAALEETQPKQPPRNPSKRSRAAEVHNLSEKRRRSRINEKMKALQNLIPNSSKTDKASMLDEAIEYLKQLQLQVQMLSMRNGLTLHPICLPGVVHPFQLNQPGIDFGDREGTMYTNLTSSLSPNKETHDSVFNLPNPYASSTRAPIGNISRHNTFSMINPEALSGQESLFPAGVSLFHLPPSSEDICREGSGMPQQQLVRNHSETNSIGEHVSRKDFITRKD